MFNSRLGHEKLVSRLDPQYYHPKNIRDDERVSLFSKECLESMRDKNSKISYGVLKPKFEKEGRYRLARIQNFSDPFLELEECAYINENQFLEYSRSECIPGDILIAIGGYAGRVGIVPNSNFRVNINQHIARYRHGSDKADRYYILIYCISGIGNRQISRLITGSVQAGVNLEDLRLLNIPLPTFLAQTYIGDKVRQAERLRTRARELEKDIARLSVDKNIEQATCAPEKRSSRIRSFDMWPRLDSKYYSNKAMAVHKACQINGTILRDLIVGISNGFEERNFVGNGKVYITVSEVSSGRLNIEDAPMIDHSVTVPQKAIVHDRCVLVVRTGSIGNVVKVFHEDSGASISSHLIRLEFDTESCAASVAAFLNSEAGKILQRKISYGAVQPQIGQEELLDLSIPNTVLANGEQILNFENAKELNFRSSSRLTTAAKLLVEALIEGQITESDLIAAQKALEAGDHELDHTILSRLTRKGMDVPDEPPLFPNLDGLYNALDGLDTLQEAP